MDMSLMRKTPLVVEEKGNENSRYVCQVSECKEVYLFIEEYGSCGQCTVYTQPSCCDDQTWRKQRVKDKLL